MDGRMDKKQSLFADENMGSLSAINEKPKETAATHKRKRLVSSRLGFLHGDAEDD